MTELRVNKPEAVRRQTNAGIRMLFGGEDPVAVITVASAAFRIARDLAKTSGSSDMEQRIKDMIKPGKENEFWTAANRPANFLKHADNDSRGILTGAEEVTESILLMCSLYYRELGYSLTEEMRVLILWCGILNPKLMTSDDPLQQYYQLPVAEAFRNLPRSEQLKYGQMMLNDRNAQALSR